MFRGIKTIFSKYKNSRQVKFLNSSKNRNFYMILNDNELDATVKTIQNFKEKIDNLVFKDDINATEGFRFVNRKAISTFGLKIKVDIIICDIHHSVIDYYENVSAQKMTHYHEFAKFIYLFPTNFIKRYNININDVFRTKRIKE